MMSFVLLISIGRQQVTITLPDKSPARFKTSSIRDQCPARRERVCFLCSLARRTGACIDLGVSCQSLEFVVAPRLAEHDFISSSREDRSELLAHQSRT